MSEEKTWPRPGDRLVHRYRKKTGEVVAEVVSVNPKTGEVAVRVEGVIYPSLSAAAQTITGHPANGWIFWGLKKQVHWPRRG